MGHRNRPGQRTPNRPAGATTTICGLIAYQYRADARRTAKTLPRRGPGESGRARAYQCRDGCELWHAGYLPQLVIDGLVTAGEWYGYAGRRPLKDHLTCLLHKMRRLTGGSSHLTRRTGADDTDLWGAMVDTDRGTFVARDYDTPAEAVRAVLDDHAQAERAAG